MTPRLIALDLDETTLDRNSRLSPRNRAALERAMDQGVEIVVATGRPLGTVPQEIRTFPGIRYAITGNGAAVCDLTTGKTMLRHLVPEQAVEQIIGIVQEEKATLEVFIQGKAYAQGDYIQHPERYMADAQTRIYVQTTRTPVPDIVAFARAHRQELDSIDLVVADLETKARLREKLTAVSEVYITTSVPRLLEVSNAACGKHRGLQFLAAYLGVAQQDTAAFGNADNDAEMLSWAGFGVAVDNASPGCKAAADYIAPPYWEDGVAQTFETVFGI